MPLKAIKSFPGVDVVVIITTYEENRVKISIEDCRSKMKQNVLFQGFKQKMTEATLLKGNSTLKQLGLIIMQLSSGSVL